MNRNQILTAMLCIAMSISHIACDKKDTSDQDVPSQEGMSSDSPDRPETEVEISPTQQQTIPAENLNIPQQMRPCTEKLKVIYAAIEKYKADNGRLPGSLDSLVPEYLADEAMTCSDVAYNYQFTSLRVSSKWEIVGGMSFHDWKTQQVKYFGDVVPMIRCSGHGSKILNISAGGQVYKSPSSWEKMFVEDYKYGDEFGADQTPDDDSGGGQGAGATKGRIEWVFEDDKWVPKQIE